MERVETLDERRDLMDLVDLSDLKDGVLGAVLKTDALDGVGGRERLSHAPRRYMDAVGVGAEAVGGVTGFESRGPLKVRFGGSSLSAFSPDAGFFGGKGRGLLARGTEKAEPMSERVSERTFMRSEGAMAGTWEDGDGGGRVSKRGPKLAER